jgi:hypothetical protein
VFQILYLDQQKGEKRELQSVFHDRRLVVSKPMGDGDHDHAISGDECSVEAAQGMDKELRGGEPSSDPMTIGILHMQSANPCWWPGGQWAWALACFCYKHGYNSERNISLLDKALVL